MPSSVLYSVDGGVGTLVLNRPERLNAFDGPMALEVLAALDEAAGDPAVRSLIFTGSGRGFCAGGDLGALEAGGRARAEGSERLPAPRAQAAAIRAMERTTELLHEMPKVTIAAVNGPCAGAGLSWACAADVRIASTSAVFTTAFLRAGQTGDYGATWLLPRLLGAARARELLLLSGRIDAAEAERIGLVSRVLADEDLMDGARSIAESVSAFAPLAVAAMKANLTDAEAGTLSETLDHEARRMVEGSATRDSREAVAAFREGRAPVFEGR